MAEHIIENAYLKVTIEDHGAELISVFDKESNIERIWCADPKVWNRHAPILFPFVGKVNQGVYRYEGKEYTMKTQHGFARDAQFTCVSQTATAVTHVLKASEATREIYPFDFELYVTHQFAAENPRVLEVKWELHNCGTQEMLYSIGAHPGFTTPAFDTETRDQYFIQFPGKESLKYILVNPQSGFAVPQTTYELQLEQGFLPIAPDLFDRDALIFENGQVDVIAIAGPDRSPYITMHCEGFPYMGVWSKPEGRFVCLEPWVGRTDDDGFAGELRNKTGEQVLPAGAQKNYIYSMEFHAINR